MKLCRDGITREVLLVRSWAIKIPKLRYGWKYFLTGLLANIQEREWWTSWPSNPLLCPVLYSSRFGFWLVMQRTEDITEEEMPPCELLAQLPTDHKPDNFGRLDGRIVLRDYGSNGQHTA